MHNAEWNTIAIIGGGASGTLLAIHLLRQARHPVQIIVIEPNESLGRGMAYSTTWHGHVLNVPAARMSALPEQDDDFVRWLRLHEPGLLPNGPDDFVPRAVYGRYLRHILMRASADAPHAAIRWVRREVLAVRPTAAGVQIDSDGGAPIVVDHVVLAIGNQPRSSIYPCSARVVNGYCWSPELPDLDADDPILIIGTGLTMIDTVLRLRARGHRGPIHAVSRHGLLPHTHAVGAVYQPFVDHPTAPRTARGLLRLVRQEVTAAAQHGVGWRAVVDALRPATQALWRDLPLVEQRRFVRHLRTYWDAHRHRIAPVVGQQLHDAITDGSVTVEAARVVEVRAISDQVELVVQPRHSRQTVMYRAAYLIDCTGPERDYDRVHTPLLDQMRSEGWLCADDLHLGLATDQHGALLDAKGVPQSWLWTFGPPLMGLLWECTAVPDIRVQAVQLARRLLGELETVDLPQHLHTTLPVASL